MPPAIGLLTALVVGRGFQAPPTRGLNRLLRLRSRSQILPRRVARPAIGERLSFVMTRHATEHLHDVRLERDDVALGHRAMAFRAIDLRLEMGSVLPEHVVRNLIDADPGNRLSGCRKFRQLLNRRTVRRDRLMTSHAEGRGRVRHQLSCVGIHVTGPALQAQRQVLLVAVRNRLNGRRGRLNRHSRPRAHPDRHDQYEEQRKDDSTYGHRLM